MASLRRKARSPFFFACYTGPDGQRVQRSTKQSDRRKAQAIANSWERAAKLGSEKRLSEAQARRVIAEIYEAVNTEPLASATAKDFLLAWVERRRADTSVRTHQAYAQVVRDFLKSLGTRAERDIAQINRTDVSNYRNLVLARTSVPTANKSLKYLRIALGAACKDGLTQDNPAVKLDVLKLRDRDKPQRRPFTVDELRTLFDYASEEWRGLILFGLYTGQRLRDIARLSWGNVDLVKSELRLVTAKTGRRMRLPIASPLLKFLETYPIRSDDPASPLFPDAFRLATGAAGDSRLSHQFYALLVEAGMAPERSKESTGLGRNRRRTLNEISFHSLRHTATSLLKNAGVPEAVAMDIIGHDSKAISQHYTHIEETSKRRALESLPDITTEA